MIENAEDLADPNNAAAAYMKLQDDVKTLILSTVMEELGRNPWGSLASQIRVLATDVVRNNSREIIDREIQNYRVVYKGTTANSY
jgi:hypothetical protein